MCPVGAPPPLAPACLGSAVPSGRRAASRAGWSRDAWHALPRHRVSTPRRRLPLRSVEHLCPSAQLSTFFQNGWPSGVFGGSRSPASSIVSIRSSPSTLSPALTRILFTTPARGAGIAVSIFIAERVTIWSPSLTTSPALTLTSTTTPGIGAPTDPASSETAFSARPEAASIVVSVTCRNQRSPLSSMITLREPSSSASPMDTSWTITVRPLSTSMVTSCPSLSGWRKSSVESLATSP
mmetsp:Transcript_27292/g.46734  ORF Transcript_27292/g.46734 Transcript_27292/m.46734 type:complete len:238 (-) Transcript_27292:3190-3903(-)